MTTAEAVLKAAEELGPELRVRAPEIESARRLPPDVLDALKEAGCFRTLVPPSHGGLGADLMTVLEMLEILARADGSTAWTVMIGSGSWLDLARLPRSSFDALFAGGDDVVFAGAFNPSASIEADSDGYRVEGRWAFASGCEHADWLFGNCIEGVVDGHPQLRLAVFAPDEVVIEDTWDVAGLRGTGSHHFRVEGVTVPAERTLVPFVDELCIDDPIVRCPIPAVLTLFLASVALGIGQGAVDDVVELAAGKVPLLSPGTLAANPTFHDAAARADTELRAARALLLQVAEETWERATSEEDATLEDRGRMRATATWVVERAEAAVDTAHRAGGGGAVYAESPLQRRLRDIQTLRQHFLVRPDSVTTAGAILTGQNPEVPIF